jgi:signal transduction histidine kinase
LTWRQAWKCLVLLVGLDVFHTCYIAMQMGEVVNFDVLLHEVILSLMLILLPYIAGYLVVREKRTRLKLLAALRELEANQALLMESIREEERLRVEANLHDVIGHQLMTLNLHLDLALQHTKDNSSDELQSTLAIARESASLMLSQVRATSRVLV